MQKITFKVDDQELSGNLFYPEHMQEQNPAVLFIHGWMSGQDRLIQHAEALSRLGYICMTVDLRGHGKSEGDINTLTRSDFLKDAVSSYNFLIRQMGVDPEKISVFGSSFGSYIALLLSSIKEIKNLVLRVPSNYPNESFDKPQVLIEGNNAVSIEWRSYPRRPNETFALEAMNNFTGKILIIESGKDEIVPHQTIENYINAIKDKSNLSHTVMQDAPHSTSAEPRFRDELKGILVDWFRDKI